MIDVLFCEQHKQTQLLKTQTKKNKKQKSDDDAVTFPSYRLGGYDYVVTTPQYRRRHSASELRPLI